MLLHAACCNKNFQLNQQRLSFGCFRHLVIGSHELSATRFVAVSLPQRSQTRQCLGIDFGDRKRLCGLCRQTGHAIKKQLHTVTEQSHLDV